jgi:hypothetical protein
MLSTVNNTYRLKRSETSNTMMVAGIQKGMIYKQTSVYIELEKVNANKHQVAWVMSQE